MAKSVKTRSYDSTRRREQAAATRREILEAAERLFERSGYAATTMAAIAKEAGVATKTVYLGFETKSGVIRSLWNLRLRGDLEETPVGRREWFLEVLEEPDPERQLRLNARNARAIKTRISSLLPALRGAAATDPDVEALWRRIQTDFHAHQRRIVESLGEKKALRKGLDVDRAADILWSLNHMDVWQLLVGERGWSADEWEQWFGDAACSQLLGRSPSVKLA